MEQDRRVWNTLEITVSYKARARLTPTLTHVVTYELVTSGAEDRAMSLTYLPQLTDILLDIKLWRDLDAVCASSCLGKSRQQARFYGSHTGPYNRS